MKLGESPTTTIKVLSPVNLENHRMGICMNIRGLGFGKSRSFAFGLALGIGAMIGCGCISSTPPAENSSGSTGNTTGSSGNLTTVNIEGSSTVYLISQAMANEFEKNSEHKVSVSRSGTGGGYKKFLLRQSDLWNASRPVAETERAELKEKGIELLELEVGIDGISVAVHPQNDWCTEMTVGQLRKLWAPDSPINKWNQINPDWPDQPIVLFGADTDSGTFEYFTEVIVGTKNSSRTQYQAATDDNVLIRGVAGSKYSLGYIPFGYCVGNADKVKVIKISPGIDEADPAPAVQPTIETILSGEYTPLARPLYVYANVETLKRPEIAAFLKFTVSPESQPLVSKRGFVQMPEEKRKEMEARLEDALKSAGATPAAQK
jgi:phosphate transport system substrate-binding protein